MSQRQSGNEDKLEALLNNYAVILDHTVLLHLGFEKFWRMVKARLNRLHKKLYVSYEDMQEVSQKCKKAGPLQERAKAVMRLVNSSIQQDLIDVRKCENFRAGDNVILKIFSQNCRRTNMALLTQEKPLSQQILQLQQACKAAGTSVKVFFLNSADFGGISEYPEEKLADGVPEQECFALYKRVTTIKDNKLPMSLVPKKGNKVYTAKSKGKVFKLKKELGRGGEGVVYEVDDKYVAKIYLPDKCTAWKQEKLQRMVNKGLHCPGICFPEAILYNSRKEFVGYLMPRAKGKKLQSNFTIRKELLKNIPDCHREDLVTLAISIMQKIKYLHDRNILVGDLNLNNVMVVSPHEVYLVDADSFQVEDLPCPVGNPDFTAPELLARTKFSDYLRNKGNENYALSVLLFMLLLPGMHPYNQTGSENRQRSITDRVFPYDLQLKQAGRVPKGDWFAIWQHMKPEVRKAFYASFKAGGAHAYVQNRLGVDAWLKLFKAYERVLKNGSLNCRDACANELFPQEQSNETDETDEADEWWNHVNR